MAIARLRRRKQDEEKCHERQQSNRVKALDGHWQMLNKKLSKTRLAGDQILFLLLLFYYLFIYELCEYFVIEHFTWWMCSWFVEQNTPTVERTVVDVLQNHVFDMDVSIMRALIAQVAAPAHSISSKIKWMLFLIFGNHNATNISFCGDVFWFYTHVELSVNGVFELHSGYVVFGWYKVIIWVSFISLFDVFTLRKLSTKCLFKANTYFLVI